jgi:hypothetical protein
MVLLLALAVGGLQAPRTMREGATRWASSLVLIFGYSFAQRASAESPRSRLGPPALAECSTQLLLLRVLRVTAEVDSDTRLVALNPRVMTGLN